MKKVIILASLLLVSACDVPPPTPEQEASIQKEQESLDRQQLELQCFDGNQKSCDDLQKLREIDEVGEVLNEAASG